MRLCIRLTVMAAVLAGVALGLITLRTDTNQLGNRLHQMFRQKRDLEKECCRLELAIARLKNQQRLRTQAATLHEDTQSDGPLGPVSPHGQTSPQGRAILVQRPGVRPH